MPDLETVDRFQTAVLWPANGYDKHGQVTVGSPVELAVRWVTKRTEVLDPEGNTIALDATVVTNQEIVIGSCMWLGTLDSWSGTGSGMAGGVGSDSEIHEVKIYKETPDIRNRATRRTVGLMRFRGATPIPPKPLAPILSVTGFDDTSVSLQCIPQGQPATAFDWYEDDTYVKTTTVPYTTVSGLAPGTDYSFFVIARNSGGGAQSNTVDQTTLSLSLPIALTLDSATGVGIDEIDLVWHYNESPFFADYLGIKVYRRVSGIGSYLLIANIPVGTSYADTDPLLFPATAYDYQVRAYNPAGDGALSNVKTGTTLSSGTPPDAPTVRIGP